MATLIAVYNSEGYVGRCDAKCYEATTLVCDCICRGRNHGAGQQKAIENMREMAEHRLGEYAQRKGLTDFKSEVGELVHQLGLW